MEVQLQKFNMKEITPDKVVVLIGKRDTGKSFLCTDLLYHHQDLPVGQGAQNKKGAALFHEGETVINNVDLAQLARGGGGGMTKQDMELAVAGGVKGLVEENRRIREQNEVLITATKKQASAFAGALRDEN